MENEYFAHNMVIYTE